MIDDLKKILFHPQTAILFIAFFAIRLLSYFVAPYFILQNILTGILLLTLITVYIRKPQYAWYLVIGEIFLGGSGHFLEFFGLSLRTIFLLTYTLLSVVPQIISKKGRQELGLPKIIMILLETFGVTLLFASINGMLHHNSTKLVIQDLIPFAYFALLIPMIQTIKDKTTYPFLIRLVSIFILGSAFFSLVTFILFSSGMTIIQGSYYHWFRDIVSGKLTNLGSGFWRVVTAEHLLLVPITLILGSYIMSHEKQSSTEKIILWVLYIAALFTLTINFSRGYFLAIFVALIPLFYTHSFKKWFCTSALTCASILIIFCTTSFIASGAKTFGLELFGLRLKSFTSPHIEESTYTRSALLKPIFQKIEEHPILGSGLGSTITFSNPITKTQITTPQFDWGYFEIITEFGIIGTVPYFFLITSILFITTYYIQVTTLQKDFLVGLLGGLTALLISNITAPALFHVFGILYLTFLMAFILHSDEMKEKIKLRCTQFYKKFIEGDVLP